MTIEVNSGAEKQYFDLLNEGQFNIQQCQDCERSIFYPRMVCPYCGSNSLNWFKPSGLGTIYSTTVVRRKPEDGGDYSVVLIDLDEGVRMMSTIEQTPPHTVAIGQRVKAQVKQQDNQALVVFTLEG